MRDAIFFFRRLYLLYVFLLYRYPHRPLSLHLYDTAPPVVYTSSERVGSVSTYHSGVCTQALGGGFHKARTAAACIDMCYMGCSRIAPDERLIDR